MNPAPEDSGHNPGQSCHEPERAGIFGLETEHVVLFQPVEPVDGHGSASDSRVLTREAPPFDTIKAVLFEALLYGRKAARSGGVKGGYFLENGGLVHLEIYLRRQSDTPILEVCTPECRTPQELVAYSRAFDSILEATSRRSEALLREAGYSGRLAFGKNNRDAWGIGFGCHENYLVYHRPSRRDRLWMAACLPLLLITAVPALVIFMFVVAFAVVGLFLGWVLPRAMVAFVVEGYQWFVATNPMGLRENLRAATYHVTNTLMFPALKIYTFMLKRWVHRPFIDQLTPFLVTRQVYSGAGELNVRAGVFELSQRAPLTRSVAEIIMFGWRKTIFDLKEMLYRPADVFRTTRKLTITCGDSNLADDPNLLKVGATALLIEMVEAGERFDDLHLKNPIKAFQEVSRGGPWKEVVLRTGARITALNLQREFWRRASRFHRALPAGRIARHDLLEAWKTALDQLAERPQRAARSLDWVAKKSLLDKAILAKSNWKLFFAWCRVLHAGGLDALVDAVSFDDFLKRAGWVRRWRLRREIRRVTRRNVRSAAEGRVEIDTEAFREFAALYFQARKIDLRYHELSADPGYERILEAAGQVTRRLSEEEVARAENDPPQDTRARIRGYFIRNSHGPETLHVNWNEIEVIVPRRHIPLPDPFYSRLPID